MVSINANSLPFSLALATGLNSSTLKAEPAKDYRGDVLETNNLVVTHLHTRGVFSSEHGHYRFTTPDGTAIELKPGVEKAVSYDGTSLRLAVTEMQSPTGMVGFKVGALHINGKEVGAIVNQGASLGITLDAFVEASKVEALATSDPAAAFAAIISAYQKKVHARMQPDPVDGPVKTNVIRFETKVDRLNAGIRPPFQKGEAVQGRVIVDAIDTEPDTNGTFKVSFISIHDTMDVRMADRYVTTVDAATKAAISSVQGFPIDLTFAIDEGQYYVSSMWNYTGSIVAATTAGVFNPSLSDLIALSAKTKAIVEGEVKKIERQGKSTLVTLRTESREHYEVLFHEDTPTLSGDVSQKLSNIKDKPLQIGDTVRIRADITDAPAASGDKMREGISAPKQLLSASYGDRVYLVAPSLQRTADYNAEREHIAAQLVSLERYADQGNFSDLRMLAAKVFKNELAPKEASRLQTIVNRVPQNERPLLVDDRWGANELFTASGIDIDSFTKNQFVGWASEQGSTNGSQALTMRIASHIDLSSAQIRTIFDANLESYSAYVSHLGRDEKVSNARAESLAQFFKWLCELNPDAALVRHMIQSAEKVSANADKSIWVRICLSHFLSDTYSAYGKRSEIKEAFKAERETIERIARNLAKDPNIYRSDVSDIARLMVEIDNLNSLVGDEVTRVINRNADKNAFFKKVQESYAESGYSCKAYNDQDADISSAVRETAVGGRVGAITDKKEKIVYFLPDALYVAAILKNESLEAAFTDSVAHELYHVQSGFDYVPPRREQVDEALIEISQGKTNGKVFQQFEALLKEEMVGTLIGFMASQGKLPASDVAPSQVPIPIGFYHTISKELAGVTAERFFVPSKNVSDDELSGVIQQIKELVDSPGFLWEVAQEYQSAVLP